MAKITLLSVDAPGLENINANNGTLTTAMDNTLSSDGTLPNQMLASLDMNSKRILNLPLPASGQEPLRFQDLSAFLGGSLVVSPLPVGGSTNAILKKNSASDFDTSWTLTPNLTSLTLTSNAIIPIIDGGI